MKTSLSVAALITIVIASAFFGRSCFPVQETVITPPVIQTVWDTVETLDTLWRTRVIKEVIEQAAKTITLVETVTVARAETIFVDKPAICPQLLTVPSKVGENTILEGFMLLPADSSHLIRSQFRSVYWTAGPLAALAVGDTLPIAITFHAPIKKGCGFWCLMLNRAVSAAAGRASCEVF